jgi:hypothetical protein
MNATAVTVSTSQATVARAIAAGRHDRGRLERAAALVALGAVEQIHTGTYRVRLQTTNGTSYTVTPDGCDCPDRSGTRASAASTTWPCG